MDFELNLTSVYAANVSIQAWSLLGWCLREIREKGHVAGLENSPELEELVKAGIVKRYGRNVRISSDVMKPV